MLDDNGSRMDPTPFYNCSSLKLLTSSIAAAANASRERESLAFLASRIPHKEAIACAEVTLYLQHRIRRGMNVSHV